MILKRIEITLTGPDEYPAGEGSYEIWEQQELDAIGALADALSELRRLQLEEGFEVEILELPRSGVDRHVGPTRCS